jgi:4-azaleucine resistance transporter AzlC
MTSINQRIEAPQFTRRGLARGARRTVPIGAAVAVYGTVFGALAAQAGMSSLEAVLMSGLVFAGAAQFIALELWATPVPILALALTALIVNLRHLLMGATLGGWLHGLRPPRLAASAALLSDESWALTTQAQRNGERDRAFLLGSGLVLFVCWVGSTAVGALAGGVIEDPEALGLDFAFTAVFLVLLVGFWRGRADLLPWTSGAAVALAVESAVEGPWYILAGGLTGSILGAWRDRRRG